MMVAVGVTFTPPPPQAVKNKFTKIVGPLLLVLPTFINVPDVFLVYLTFMSILMIVPSIYTYTRYSYGT
jgi:hypothetical protein